MLKRVVPESGWTSVDWSQFLGMVNVAAVLYWDASLATSAAPSTFSHRAFVVGINTYSAVKPLTKCVGDAQAMAALLDRKGYDVVTLLDPTRAQLVTAFEAFCASLTSRTQKVVVHFSGHGVAPVGEQFLIAADASGPCAAAGAPFPVHVSVPLFPHGVRCLELWMCACLLSLYCSCC